MHFIYPCLPYSPRIVDPMWEPAYEWARAQGLATGLIDSVNAKVWFPTPGKSAQAIYRGWMLNGAEYDWLAQLVPLAISTAEYLSSHHATGWYDAVANHTFPGRFLTQSAPLDFTADRRYFVKGLAKPFSADSVLATQSQLDDFWQRQELPASTPLFVRDFTDLKPASARRFFVVQAQAIGAAGALVPASLRVAIASLQPRLFYSFDVAETLAGQSVLVEVGDGQVSNLKEWTVAEFGSRVLVALAEANVIR